MAQRNSLYYDSPFYSPWSEDATGAPWWIESGAMDRMARFACRLCDASDRSADMANLNNYDAHYFFVYGTLKRGFAAHDMLRNCTFVARAWTGLERFKMVVGDFPAVLFEPDGSASKAVQGEVYLVPTAEIKYLDTFEGNGTLYRRRKLSMNLDTGTQLSAWIYLGVPSAFSGVSDLAPSFTRKKTSTEYYSFTKASKA